MKYLLFAALLLAPSAPAWSRAGDGDGGYSSGYSGGSSGGYSSGYSGGYSGGYSSGYSGRRRRKYGLFDLIFMGVIFLVLTVKNWFTRTAYGRGGGGYSGGHSGYSGHKGYNGYGSARAAAGPTMQADRVAPRAEVTAAILRALGRKDPAFNPAALEDFARDVFLKVQAAWQNRDYSDLRGVMMPHLHASYSSKVESMRVRGEINMMEDVQVLRADFVHVRCPKEKEGRSVTVLFTASAKDYTINERTNFVRNGSAQPQTFQEYWTFHQLNGEWALARVDQTGEMDFLNAPNLPSDPQGAGSIPAAKGTGKETEGDAPWQPRPSANPLPATPEDPFERGAEMLKSITPAAAAAGFARPPAPPPQPGTERPADPHWDRQKMEIAATLAFENVYEAWGRNDSSLISADFVSAEALARLKKIMEDRKGEGITFEFKSLFARRAEVVLTSHAEKSRLRLDEFTARINATAARTMLRNGRPLHREEAPAPFTEYWVFGRQNQSWKLRDILPRMDQECEDRSKDGAPGPAQIEWYWQP